jgi:hypothetical protein
MSVRALDSYFIEEEAEMPDDFIVRRKGDGGKEDYLEIHLSHDGDVYVKVKGVNMHGEPSEAQVEFCAKSGGGYHPKTIIALANSAKAMDRDNKDPDCKERYREEGAIWQS